MGRLGTLVALSLFVAACGAAPGHGARTPARGRAATPHGHDRLVGEYDVHWDAATGMLDVQAQIAADAGPTFVVDRGADAFVRDLPAEKQGNRFIVPACDKGDCRFHYRFALREAARHFDDIDVATTEGQLVLAPPSTWIVAPGDAGENDRIRFRVTTSEGTSFATGVLRAGDAYEITLDDLWTSPYSAFGPMRTIEVPAKGGTIDLAIGAGKLALTDADLTAWTANAAKSIVTYYERFPMKRALVLLVPGRGGWVGGGRTLSGGGGTVFIRVGERATKAALADDWVLVHEMVHLTFPSAPQYQDWAEEGVATYVEPFARTRAGLISAEEALKGLYEGVANGEPQAGDEGLDRTHTWGRVYWGGALFYLLADVEIRKQTNNQKGLEHALRGMLAAGKNNGMRLPLDETFALGDAATGTHVLRDLHAAMGTSPHPVDLGALFRSLGVVVVNDKVKFDDTAPLAPIRRAITTGSP